MLSHGEHELDTANEQQSARDDVEVPSPAEVVASAKTALETFKTARAQIDEEVTDLEKLREKIETDHEEHVRELQEEKSQQKRVLEAQRQELAEKMADLESRQESVSAMFNQMDVDRDMLSASMRELEERKEQFELERNALASSAKELGERDLHITKREHDLAQLQRGLERLTDSQRSDVDQQAPPAPVETPNTAGATTADQFRKLRRDAKRRAIGI